MIVADTGIGMEDVIVTPVGVERIVQNAVDMGTGNHGLITVPAGVPVMVAGMVPIALKMTAAGMVGLMYLLLNVPVIQVGAAAIAPRRLRRKKPQPLLNQPNRKSVHTSEQLKAGSIPAFYHPFPSGDQNSPPFC